jgi:hypothetical protein
MLFPGVKEPGISPICGFVNDPSTPRVSKKSVIDCC